MGLKEWFINFFYEEAETKKVLEQVKDSSEVKVSEKIEAGNSASLPIYETSDSLVSFKDILNQKTNLPFDKIKSEAQIINNIIDDLKQDIDSMADNADRKEEIANVISARVRNMALRGANLCEMLSKVENDYYNRVVENIKVSNSENLVNFSDSAKQTGLMLKQLQKILDGLQEYDIKFNSEKNESFVQLINSEADSFLIYLNNLKENIMNSVINSAGLSSKIDLIEQLVSVANTKV